MAVHLNGSVAWLDGMRASVASASLLPRFGAEFAAKLHKPRPRPGDSWHMDEVYLRINDGV
jgi:hypothetical protein